MVCTVRFLIVSALLFCVSIAFAADVKYDIDGDKLKLELQFAKGYSNVNTLKLDKSFVVSFESNEDIEFQQTFWDLPVKSIFVSSDGVKKRLIAEFESEVTVPEILSQPKVLKVSFPFPKSVTQPVTVGKKAYAKMVWGLLIILALILFMFWVAKVFFRKQVFSDIPGAGRLLGKADLDLRKNLYFYEVDEKIYIIGVTDASMNLIDKIDDEDSVTRIKAGFSKKADFGNYMKLFKKSPQVKDEVEISRESINERLKSLKER